MAPQIGQPFGHSEESQPRLFLPRDHAHLPVTRRGDHRQKLGAVSGLADGAGRDNADVADAQAFRPADEGGDDIRGPLHRRLLQEAGRRLPLPQPRHALLLVERAPFGPGGLYHEQADRVGAEIDGGQPPHVAAG